MTEKIFTESLEAIRMKIADGGFIGTCEANLIKSVVSLLHIYFPKDENGFSEIEHFAFDCNFGRCGETLETESMLYKRLTKT